MRQYYGQQYIYLFGLIIALGFMGWYYAQPSLQLQYKDEAMLSRLPDVIVTQLTLTQFDAKGNLAHRFFTPKLIHLPYESLSQFTHPQIVLQTKEGNPWFIRSNQGIAKFGLDCITLFGHVTFHQQESSTGKERTITTEEITYDVKKDFVTTSKMVYIQEPGLRIQSQGMTAYPKQQKINLLQHVSSEYIPNVAQKQAGSKPLATQENAL